MSYLFTIFIITAGAVTLALIAGIVHSEIKRRKKDKAQSLVDPIIEAQYQEYQQNLKVKNAGVSLLEPTKLTNKKSKRK